MPAKNEPTAARPVASGALSTASGSTTRAISACVGRTPSAGEMHT